MKTPDKPTPPPTPTPTPTAEDLENARDLPWDVVDRAIARFEETRAHAERTQELLEFDAGLNQFAELETRLAVDAESHLVNCILATDPGSDQFVSVDLERFWAPTRGVRSGNVTYLVTPQEPRETSPGRIDGPVIMRLVIVRGDDAILDMGDLERFTRLTRRAEPPQPTTEAPATPPRPFWVETISRAAETLGEDEAMRRMFDAPRKPGA